MSSGFDGDEFGGDGWSDDILVDLDEFVDKYVGRSATDEYVIFSYCKDESILVVDRGDLDYCFQRMKDMFELAYIEDGLAMMCKERFDTMIETY